MSALITSAFYISPTLCDMSYNGDECVFDNAPLHTTIRTRCKAMFARCKSTIIVYLHNLSLVVVFHCS